jgi:hypothetical protein
VLRVTVRGAGAPTVVLHPGETLVFGRAPQVTSAAADPAKQHRTTLTLPHCAPHVSRVVGELAVGAEIVRLRWRASTTAHLASLFDAPGGARRVTLAEGMSALLDEGENHVTILRGRWVDDGYRDLLVVVDVAVLPAGTAAPAIPAARDADHDVDRTGPAPGLTPYGREWFVALALAEPWLSGADDYPRPPTNREIYERVLAWHGYAWNLDKAQRVDDAIKAVASVAFGPREDPFTTAAAAGRAQNIRYAVGRRAAEVGLVTADDLERAYRAARGRPE